MVSGMCLFLFGFVSLDLLETEVEYDEQAAEALVHVKLSLFQQIECSIESVSVDLQIMGPRCKIRTSSDERLVVCSNSSCGATFRSKSTSVRVEFIVCETGEIFFIGLLNRLVLFRWGKEGVTVGRFPCPRNRQKTAINRDSAKRETWTKSR